MSFFPSTYNVPPFFEKPPKHGGQSWDSECRMEGDTHIGLGENAASICKLSSLQSTVDADINSTQTTTVYCNRPSNLHRHRFSIFLSLVFGNCLFPAIVTMKSHSGPKHSHGLWLGPTTRSPPPSKRHPS